MWTLSFTSGLVSALRGEMTCHLPSAFCETITLGSSSQRLSHPFFPKKEAEAQRAEIIYLSSHSWLGGQEPSDELWLSVEIGDLLSTGDLARRPCLRQVALIYLVI